ncbi:sensor histidine kinase [Paenibacillus chartarius]|uniref:histidine kinase n=1 Tax=Paenibacillus chartarius TaxID=747481 RepID=A0ABV6DU36_9BACL
MWSRLAQWNTLRNQILFGFVTVMLVVLVCAGIVTFIAVSNLLTDKAEKQMKQTAIQANGRLEALISQIDTLTTQAVNDMNVQHLLQTIVEGRKETFEERQALLQFANSIQGYSDSVSSVELYTSDYRRLFPLDEQPLSERLSQPWIERADAEKGKLVWIGVDPNGSDSVLAIRRVNLVDRWFSGGGYLLIRMKSAYFNLQAPLSGGGQQESILLVDQAAQPIVVDGAFLPDLEKLQRAESQTVTWKDQHYVLVRETSERTGWTLMILYPVNAITEGISVLRSAVLASGALGLILFLVLSFVLSTMITRPILRLMKAMRNTRQGVLTPSTVVSYTSELNDLNMTYNHMVEDINRLIKLVYEEELLRSRAELQALQAQINPHFLYNTLEALNWSLQERDQEDLAELVVGMSELFRYVIGSPGKDAWVTIGEELEHVETYLRIMSVRCGERLEWSLECPDPFRFVRMPRLLIQPLVENAILHGVEGKTGQGRIDIRIEAAPDDDRLLCVSVRDDGPGMEASRLQAVKESILLGTTSSARGNGMGLSNVHRRLQLYYSASAPACSGLVMESTPGLGVTVSFMIPKDEEENGYAAAAKSYTDR